MYFQISSDKLFDLFEEVRLRSKTASQGDHWLEGAHACIKILDLTFDYEAYVRGVEVREKCFERPENESDHEISSVSDEEFVDLWGIAGTPSQ